ncbi:amidase [Roseitranquillus sediminis]|uniref:amidase n=1 Tax=Roseitranquillus sediminis TaxID=2809051 RepID=UPI001D0BF650|nr:amidase [Roseitranquillus sediminis]
MDEWRTMGAAALGREIGAGRIDPTELAEVMLDAIARHPHGHEIYARTTPDRARAEARAARERARAGLQRGPLDGVPVSWKDLFDTAGTATEGGSALLAGRVPAADARVVARATAAGLVCLGKTHLTELAFSGLGLNPVTGTPPNVHDAEALPGGSSSGAAASVAFGLAAGAIGSDTAGSVRIPAAWNDLVGLKTSHGVIPLDGALPLCPSFDTAGPLARMVEDAALLTAAMQGGRPPDLRGASLQGARLLVLETVAFDAIDDGPARGFDEALKRLADAGAEIARIEAPEVAEAVDLSASLFAPEAYGTWSAEIEARPELMFDPVRERFRGGRDFPAHAYVAGWARLRELRQIYRARTAGADAVILPTCAIAPPKRQAVLDDHALFAERNLMTLRNTRIGSLLDLCGLTLPTGTPSAGILFQAPGGQDARLLRLGAAAEGALA